MNFYLQDEIGKMLENDLLSEAIAFLESKLSQQTSDRFRPLLGKTFLHLDQHVTSYISSFYYSLQDAFTPRAFYAEMNDFTINWDLWYLDIFAFDKVEGTDDLDWLADWDPNNCAKERFPLTGMEDLQTVFQNHHVEKLYEIPDQVASADIAELLVVVRQQELIQAASKIAIEKTLPWNNIPIFATAHDYELIYRTLRAMDT